MKLYSFYWDCGRMGSIAGLLTHANIKELYGKHIDFGSVLGKHSEIYGVLGPEDFTLLSADPAEVAVFERLLPYGFGHNPLEYLDPEDDE